MARRVLRRIKRIRNVKVEDEWGQVRSRWEYLFVCGHTELRVGDSDVAFTRFRVEHNRIASGACPVCSSEASNE